MTKRQLLAAELFHYSYDHYADHLEGGNLRFTQYMPQDVDILRRATTENWSHPQIAKALEIDEKDVPRWLEDWKRAKSIVNAKNPSESFRLGVKYSISDAFEQGLSLDDNDKIDELVIQICYRAADLGYLLDLAGSKLSDYSEWLRREKDVDYSLVDLPNLE